MEDSLLPACLAQSLKVGGTQQRGEEEEKDRKVCRNEMDDSKTLSFARKGDERQIKGNHEKGVETHSELSSTGGIP